MNRSSDREPPSALDPMRDARPKYRVLQDRIRQGIAEGTLGDRFGRLPAEHDLARHYGVAYMTVRAAVNGLVTAGLLYRIHGKGTFVHAEPRGPAAAAGILALIVPSLSSFWSVAGLYYFPGIVQGFCAEATRLGYEPVVIGRSKDALASLSEELGNIAGAACLLRRSDDGESLEALRTLRIPVVGINAYGGDRHSIACIAADQVGGVEEAVRFLAARGHRRIAFLPGPVGNISADERLRGFQRAAAALGLSGAFVAEEGPADYTDASGAVRTRALLVRSDRPTAILAAGDLIAAGVLQAASEAGLTVPEDLSVIGYGDFEIAAFLQPGLTTVRLPLAALGSGAARNLHEQATATTSTRRAAAAVLKTALIERGSVAPPRERGE